MTEKQESILKAALRLFATQGYASTSTSKVAKEAGVSEGLIFRHFGNKEGLLNAILEMAQEAGSQKWAPIVLEPDPKKVITKCLEMPFGINKNEYEMWRLVYAIKWQTDNYDTTSFEPIKLVLRNAFEKLGFEDPDAEVELIMMYVDGAATSFILHEPSNKLDILKSLKQKYQL
ncbi:MAG: TetR/AcrR family transcriptional regulator [Flavobacteriales bacterium]